MNLIENVFFMDHIRVQGGAYYYGCNFYKDNTASFVSSDDPHILETVMTIQELPKFIESFNADKKTMEGYIFSVLADLKEELNIEKKAIKATTDYLNG